MFSIRTAAVAIVSFFVLSQGVVALSSEEAVTNNNVLSSQYQTIKTALSAIDKTSSGGTVITTSQEVVNQFNTVIVNLNGDSAAMQASTPFDDAEADPVLSSLATYVTIHQDVMAVLIAKHPMFAQFGVTAPMIAVLRSLEASIDVFSFAMLRLTPTRNAEVSDDQNALDTSTAGAITVYNQLCVPSPLYPSVMPICVN